MKKWLFAVLLCHILAAAAMADYVNPPGWDTNPYFTHQSYSFDTNASSGLADAGYTNPGYPVYQAGSDGEWLDDLGDGRSGGWVFKGIRTDPSFTNPMISLDIPNTADPSMTKELWFQMTFRCDYTYDTLSSGIAAVDYSYNPFSVVSSSVDVVSYPAADDLAPLGASWWWRLTAIVEITPQPAGEYILISPELINEWTGLGEHNSFIVIDQIDVDTRCTPEPATMSLIALGGLALLRRRRQ